MVELVCYNLDSTSYSTMKLGYLEVFSMLKLNLYSRQSPTLRYTWCCKT